MLKLLRALLNQCCVNREVTDCSIREYCLVKPRAICRISTVFFFNIGNSWYLDEGNAAVAVSCELTG